MQRDTSTIECNVHELEIISAVITSKDGYVVVSQINSNLLFHACRVVLKYFCVIVSLLLSIQ